MSEPWQIVFALIVGPWMAAIFAAGAWRHGWPRGAAAGFVAIWSMAAVVMAALEVLKHG